MCNIKITLAKSPSNIFTSSSDIQISGTCKISSNARALPMEELAEPRRRMWVAANLLAPLVAMQRTKSTSSEPSWTSYGKKTPA